jgi:hypothetical protein
VPAFRLLDEPTPWRNALAARADWGRRARGAVPAPWRSVPWRVPTDLQDRTARPRQTGPIGGTESGEMALLKAALRVAADKTQSCTRTASRSTWKL